MDYGDAGTGHEIDADSLRQLSASADGLTKRAQEIASIDLNSLQVDIVLVAFPDIANALPNE